MIECTRIGSAAGRQKAKAERKIHRDFFVIELSKGSQYRKREPVYDFSNTQNRALHP